MEKMKKNIIISIVFIIIVIFLFFLLRPRNDIVLIDAPIKLVLSHIDGVGTPVFTIERNGKFTVNLILSSNQDDIDEVDRAENIFEVYAKKTIHLTSEQCAEINKLIKEIKDAPEGSISTDPGSTYPSCIIARIDNENYGCYFVKDFKETGLTLEDRKSYKRLKANNPLQKLAKQLIEISPIDVFAYERPYMKHGLESFGDEAIWGRTFFWHLSPDLI